MAIMAKPMATLVEMMVGYYGRDDGNLGVDVGRLNCGDDGDIGAGDCGDDGYAGGDNS